MAMNEKDREGSNETYRRCIACNCKIDETVLSFEQRLIEDKEFCRACFDEILNDSNYEIRMPLLKVK